MAANDVNAIMRILPHRYPFLLVDRVLEMEDEKRIVAIKNVTVNEPFFPGHFPGQPVMPGVLIIEALAQTGGVLLLRRYEDPSRKLILFTGVDECRWRRQVVPGDTLRLEIEVLKLRERVCKMAAKAYVGDDLAAEAILMAAVADLPQG